MSKNKSSDGFGALGLLLILVIVGGISFAGWSVYRAQTKPSTTKSENNNQSTNNTPSTASDLSKTYTDPVGNFSIKYPSDWTLAASSNTSDPNFATSEATLSSPSGTVLKLGSNWGGRGGFCVPEDSEKPFTPGNTCPSVEYLSSEALPIANVYYASLTTGADGTSGNVFKKSNIVLATKHYMDNAGKSEYVIGITDSNPPDELQLNKPIMGLVISDFFFTPYNAAGKFYPYIYAYASGADASFLQSKDVSTIKDILRTMVVNLPE